MKNHKNPFLSQLKICLGVEKVNKKPKDERSALLKLYLTKQNKTKLTPSYLLQELLFTIGKLDTTTN